MRLRCRHGRRADLQQRGDGIWRLRLRRDNDDIHRQRHHDRGDHGHRNGFGYHRFDDHRSRWRWGSGGNGFYRFGRVAGGVKVDAGASDGAGGSSAGAGGTSDEGALATGTAGAMLPRSTAAGRCSTPATRVRRANVRASSTPAFRIPAVSRATAVANTSRSSRASMPRASARS